MNRIVKNFLLNGLSSIIGQIVTFVTVAYYAQLIGKDFFGSITLAQQIILYFSIAVLFGLQTLGIRMISNDTKQAKEAVSEIISFRLIIALGSFLIIGVLSLFMNNSYSFNIILFFFSFTLFPLAMNLDWLYIGFEKMHHNAVYNLCKSVIPGIIILIFLKESSNIYIIPLAMFIGVFIGVVYQYVIITFKYKIKFKFMFDFVKFRNLGMLAFPFLTSGLLAMVNNNIDKLIIGVFRNKGELGVYQAAYTFISFFITVEAMVFTPIFPALINLYKENNLEKLKTLSQGLSKYIFILILPIALGGWVLSKDIIRLVYGAEYVSAYLPFNILLIYILILYCREIYAYQLNAWNGEMKYLKTVSISAALNAILCFAFVPAFGYVAAAMITTATEIINLVLMRRDSNKLVKIKFFENPFIILPALLMIVFTYILKSIGANIITNLLISILVYSSLLVLLKVVKIEEIKGLLSKS
jgi:O-antigen/teichoic acid export membrane protein